MNINNSSQIPIQQTADFHQLLYAFYKFRQLTDSFSSLASPAAKLSLNAETRLRYKAWAVIFL